jgi:hypothetical protein
MTELLFFLILKFIIMAKIEYGAIITNISGHLGGAGFASGPNGPYMRIHRAGHQARSAKQSIVKSLFSVTSQAWRGLDPAERISWKTLAGSLGKSAFGFRLFSHYYLDALHSGITPATSAPDPNSGFRVADPNFTISRSPDLLQFSYTGTIGVNESVLIFAGPPLSAGVSFSTKGLRLIKVCRAADTSPVNLTTAYSNTFGFLFQPGSQAVLFCRSTPSFPGSYVAGGSFAKKPKPTSTNEPTAGAELAKILK